MAATKTIGILTGGGDVPGLNPCIKQLVTRAAHCQFSVLGIRRGWQGLWPGAGRVAAGGEKAVTTELR